MTKSVAQQIREMGNRLAAIHEADEKMPSKSHIMKMCKDGKTKAEICKMHPNCDQSKLKDMIDDCMDKTKTNESVVFEATNDAYAALAKTAYPNAQTIVKIARAMDKIGMNGGGWLRGVIPEKGDKYSFIWDGQSQPSGITKMGKPRNQPSGITKMGRPRNLPRDGGNPGGTTKSIPTNKPQPGLPKTTEV